ncbi:hypothetical protein AN944_00748 [Shewanella sp. P1-14-1]|uniref:hypothetical protein n=1 Tax=Shewanella sp. P1-14-1 TaxID=1723761 RepID=UPI0006D67F36|nr:hypothetical protein [Shewanella sp. P1-14-1]KPZ72506.1 hypothetical protein AN944_00748 [Shewanella sp. P1-14-1]
MDKTDSYQGNATFTHLKARSFAAIVLALITATIMIPGMTTYLPFHQNDAIGIPILLFSFIWTALFIYSYMATSVKYVYLIMLTLIISHSLLAYFSLVG